MKKDSQHNRQNLIHQVSQNILPAITQAGGVMQLSGAGITFFNQFLEQFPTHDPLQDLAKLAVSYGTMLTLVGMYSKAAQDNVAFTSIATTANISVFIMQPENQTGWFLLANSVMGLGFAQALKNSTLKQQPDTTKTPPAIGRTTRTILKHHTNLIVIIQEAWAITGEIFRSSEKQVQGLFNTPDYMRKMRDAIAESGVKGFVGVIGEKHYSELFVGRTIAITLASLQLANFKDSNYFLVPAVVSGILNNKGLLGWGFSDKNANIIGAALTIFVAQTLQLTAGSNPTSDAFLFAALGQFCIGVNGSKEYLDVQNIHQLRSAVVNLAQTYMPQKER
jgi:hypothetical protein